MTTDKQPRFTAEPIRTTAAKSWSCTCLWAVRNWMTFGVGNKANGCLLGSRFYLAF